jgi:hypothetical protein
VGPGAKSKEAGEEVGGVWGLLRSDATSGSVVRGSEASRRDEEQRIYLYRSDVDSDLEGTSPSIWDWVHSKREGGKVVRQQSQPALEGSSSPSLPRAPPTAAQLLDAPLLAGVDRRHVGRGWSRWRGYHLCLPLRRCQDLQAPGRCLLSPHRPRPVMSPRRSRPLQGLDGRVSDRNYIARGDKANCSPLRYVSSGEPSYTMDMRAGEGDGRTQVQTRRAALVCRGRSAARG